MKQSESFKNGNLTVEAIVAPSATQSHYREGARWEIFMEQELRFVDVENIFGQKSVC